MQTQSLKCLEFPHPAQGEAPSRCWVKIYGRVTTVCWLCVLGQVPCTLWALFFSVFQEGEGTDKL